MQQEKVMIGLIFASALVGAVARSGSKMLQDYVLSLSRFKETPFGRKFVPNFESKIAAGVERVAAWDVRKKLAGMRKVCDITAVGSFLLFIICGVICAMLKLRQPDFVFVPLLYVFMAALFGRACFAWTLDHKRAVRWLAIYFGVGMLVFMLFVALLLLAVSLKDPQFPVTLISGASEDMRFLAFFLTITAAIIGSLYAATWLILGSPIAIGGAGVWLASKSASLIVSRYSEHTLVYLATALRVVSWVTPMISLLLTMLLVLTGADWLLSLLSPQR